MCRAQICRQRGTTKRCELANVFVVVVGATNIVVVVVFMLLSSHCHSKATKSGQRRKMLRRRLAGNWAAAKKKQQQQTIKYTIINRKRLKYRHRGNKISAALQQPLCICMYVCKYAVVLTLYVSTHDCGMPPTTITSALSIAHIRKELINCQ